MKENKKLLFYIISEIIIGYLTLACFKFAHHTFVTADIYPELKDILIVCFGWIPAIMGIMVLPMNIYMIYKIWMNLKNRRNE